ncbi:hypothetical protein [Pseudomonas sp. 10S4]|uniref:hypothetical protein n=1 Tax=Pseudomonas sp. 10S4 TaxID=3048583 RepID=UPI003A103481
MTNPNVITVQLALVSAILRKDSFFNPMKTDPNLYPFCGLPSQIYTDNAAEFISPELMAKCARHGIDWDHRPIGKSGTAELSNVLSVYSWFGEFTSYLGLPVVT